MKAQRSRIAQAAVMAAGVALAMTACAPGGSTAEGGNKPTAVSTDVAGAGDVTLKLSDFWGSAEGEWIDQLVEDFEAKYPNVTIERTQEDWGKLTSTLNLQLQDSGGPDIASANNGWQSLGTLAKGGLVLDLDGYADLYGWDDAVPTTIARQNKFTTDFATIGEGAWFGTPVARGSLLGIYYNAEKLKALGIDEPTTLEEFEAALTTAKDAGEVPISYSGVDSNTTILFALQAVYGDKDKINDFVYDNPDVKATDTGFPEAATTLKKWADDGMLTPNFQGLDYETTKAEYLDGEGVFRFDYTGALGLDEEQQNQFGYIQLPQATSEDTVGVGAAPGAMVISSKCEHPDVAAAFLDFLMSAEASQAAVDLGLVPMLNADIETPDVLSFTGEVAATTTLDADDGYVPYFDWSSPTMLEIVSQNTQELLEGKTTVEDFTKAVDNDRDTFIADELGS